MNDKCCNIAIVYVCSFQDVGGKMHLMMNYPTASIIPSS